ncbi:adhesion G-protein coupled receptor G5-like isoform X1 [Acanthopagrus latus]|uniref:adhesion G-protein coupled receptor G5-like isoform X1 n=1 Tax=Acanthopagrus latus TaxID=8177 RepID=UPI00187BE92C|nr:adhesion G-protein coupled receptor G5-like isoform X1 [Acanthopagrus latus]
MWITRFFITLTWLSQTRAGVTQTDICENVIAECKGMAVAWTRCYEDRIATCNQSNTRSLMVSHFIRKNVTSFQEVEVNPTLDHRVHIPSSALQRSRGAGSEDKILLVATVIDSYFFEDNPKPSPPPGRGRGRKVLPVQPNHMRGTVMGGLVLVVRAGNNPVRNLPQPITLIFNHKKQVENGTCVFWQESELEHETGHWSRYGCDTNNTGTEFICSCNHLSFFAVLVNPELLVDERNAVALNYITYIGSALSVFFTIISLIIYVYLQKKRPEKAIGVHMNLAGALLCLHLSFLLCSFWVWLMKEKEEGWVCRGLGLFLHWSLLATFTWMALEGFHLYLLLVRVFNIYVRRYLLKLCLVGWGLPTLTAVICGISGVYGKYSLKLMTENNHSSTAEICWMSSQFPQRLVVSYISTVAFPCLVILCNSCMLGLVVFRLWGLRKEGGVNESRWKKMNKEKGTRLWKDCATVLGLSCVLGLTWGLASTTYISLSGIYVFTILNSLQGVFMFLWSLALTHKSRSDNDSSVRDPSSQKMMTTSFNN